MSLACHKYSRSFKGFSLLEMVAVTLMAGMMMQLGLGVYTIYKKNKYLRDSYDEIQAVNSSIMRYYGVAKRYPCPANASLPPDDPNYGVEDCDLGPAPPPIAQGTCRAPGFCKAGGRDTGLDGALGPDSILIGAIPFKTIIDGMGSSQNLDGLTYEKAVDPRGNLYTYAVTHALTNASGFNEAMGAIAVAKEDGVSLVDPPGSVHYVVISHGQNAAGAFSAATGVPSSPCTDGSPLEQQNCDNDGAFMNALFNQANPSTYNDDLIVSQTWTLSSLWGVGANGLDIFNRNPGNVGVGTSVPVDKLEVVGSARVTGNSQSQRICDSGGSNCFPAESLGGPTGIDCKNQTAPVGYYRALTGIANAAPNCSGDLAMPPVNTNQPPCPLDGSGNKQFVTGFDVTGNIICSSF